MKKSFLTERKENVYQFIVNPHAGRGKGITSWQQVESVLKQTDVTYDVKFTKEKGEAIHLAKTATDQNQWTAVVAVGGDGTVHEVANGLYKSNVPLGYVPAGTGNDFAREWNIPFNPIQAWQRIAQHEVKQSDIILADNRVVLCYISAGFDGYVSRLVDASSWKKALGKASYFLGALLSLKSFQPYTLELQLDENDYRFENVWLVTMSNGKSLGGGMMITPHANPTDGLIDLCIVHKLTKIDFLRVFPKVYAGKHVDHPAVTFLQGKQATVKTEPKMWAFADGEEVGNQTISLEIIPNGIFLL
jgi:YegS/Rv2252/BmrU family lipid kinase